MIDSVVLAQCINVTDTHTATSPQQMRRQRTAPGGKNIEHDCNLDVDPIVTSLRIMLHQSNVNELETELPVPSDCLYGTRAASSRRVAEREVWSDEVGAVMVGVCRRRPAHVYHLRIYTDKKLGYR